ncbi:hypothetical protein [Methylobacter marinus]|uniref:hypothetical protein n=1 Tax=Methylobacter marinus TaxID=34058 RepID=UPI000372A2D2|nr:hypothetical protein [Methylobacter marinus]
MAYQTGTVASPAALKSVIESFCTNNGFGLTANWLSKGQSNVTLTVDGTKGLHITGANSADGTVELCPFSKQIYIVDASWPVTYYLFYSANPDQVVCVLQYDTNKIQTIMFGEIVKIHSSAFVGGNWFFASRGGSSASIGEPVFVSITDAEILSGVTTLYGSFQFRGDIAIPFSTGVGGWTYKTTGLHAKIDGSVWDSTDKLKVTPTDYTVSSLFRSPNAWNNQALLVPIHLQFAMADNFKAYLGYVEHIRYIRIDNYEIGDIVTLGTDRWKVFPWIAKNAAARNASVAATDSGTVGFAVRYDGP